MTKHHNHLVHVATWENSAKMVLSAAGKATAEWIVATGTRGISFGVTTYAHLMGVEASEVAWTYENLMPGAVVAEA